MSGLTREQLEARVAELEAKVNKPIQLKVSSKGGVSVYGLGQRFPVTLYKGQWEKILAAAPQIDAFLKSNASVLASKE